MNERDEKLRVRASFRALLERGAVRVRDARERSAVERERGAREREPRLRGAGLLLLYYRNFKKTKP